MWLSRGVTSQESGDLCFNAAPEERNSSGGWSDAHLFMEDKYRLFSQGSLRSILKERAGTQPKELT